MVMGQPTHLLHVVHGKVIKEMQQTHRCFCLQFPWKHTSGVPVVEAFLYSSPPLLCVLVCVHTYLLAHNLHFFNSPSVY